MAKALVSPGQGQSGFYLFIYIYIYLNLQENSQILVYFNDDGDLVVSKWIEGTTLASEACCYSYFKYYFESRVKTFFSSFFIRRR